MHRQISESDCAQGNLSLCTGGRSSGERRSAGASPPRHDALELWKNRCRTDRRLAGRGGSEGGEEGKRACYHGLVCQPSSHPAIQRPLWRSAAMDRTTAKAKTAGPGDGGNKRSPALGRARSGKPSTQACWACQVRCSFGPSQSHRIPHWWQCVSRRSRPHTVLGQHGELRQLPRCRPLPWRGREGKLAGMEVSESAACCRRVPSMYVYRAYTRRTRPLHARAAHH